MAPSRLRALADRSLAEYHHARRTAKEEEVQLKQLERDLKSAEECQKVVQAVAQAVQRQAHRKIARVVTKCLKAVFGENAYEFAIDFERKRGKTEARLVFLRDGHRVDPVSASGGGVVDVASFALRLAALLLSVPQRRKFLCLDEPLKHLSRNHSERVRVLLETISRELGVQVLMVTHDSQLACGKIIRIGGNGGNGEQDGV